jgi:putative chitinase
MEIAMISAMWFFKNNVLDKLDIDSKTTVKEVTKKVNGGTNGLDDRKEIHSEAKNNIDCAD